jgi:hypothetical protein
MTVMTLLVLTLLVWAVEQALGDNGEAVGSSAVGTTPAPAEQPDAASRAPP